MRYELIIFDWDGTIMDSTGLIADSIQRAARDMALPVPTEAVAKSIIGLGIHESVSRLFPDLPRERQAEFALAYRHHFVVHDHEAPVYAGIHALLGELAAPERFLAVATGKPRSGLERAFAHTGLKKHFHFSRCADEGFPKPHPDMLQKLMEFTSVTPDRTLMIGDTTHDLELAENAGVDALAVSYGAHPRNVLANARAEAVLDSVEDLSVWLKNHG